MGFARLILKVGFDFGTKVKKRCVQEERNLVLNGTICVALWLERHSYFCICLLGFALTDCFAGGRNRI